MGRNRSTEIWHIPKRASLHQIIGALNVIKYYKLDGKKWPNSRKKFDQKFAIWGFTSRGRSLSKNASETLEALLKYLGLIYVDDNKLIRITPAGQALIDEHPLTKPIVSKRKLKDTISEMGNINSEVITHQMMKLILTNPSILKYCKNLNIFPFRETILFLLDDDIKYLSPDEIAMFLFFMRNKSERLVVKKSILNFRKLPAYKRYNMIMDFKNTPEGKLTLVKAPTSTYWRQLCTNTGLFEVVKKNLYLKNSSKIYANELLELYNDEIYNFQDNLKLWNEYFTSTSINLPINLTITPIITSDNKYLLSVSNNSGIIGGELIKKGDVFKIPVFPCENHLIKVVDLNKGNEVYSKCLNFDQIKSLKIEIKDSLVHKKKDLIYYSKLIKQLTESKTLDKDYEHQLEIIGNNLGIDFLSKTKIPSIRGGRLEFLFYKLLEILEDQEKISELKWNGSLDKYGISRPAPGTQRGLSDIMFKCGEINFLLELTTIKGATAQWKAEGSSVPHHIRNFDPSNTKKVIGIFSPPITHEKIDKSIKTALIPNKYNIMSIEICNLVNLFNNSSDICDDLIKILKQQYKNSGIEIESIF